MDISSNLLEIQPLGNLSQPTSSTSPAASKVKPPSSPLLEVAKKWKDAKNKLVPKDKSKLFSNVISLKGGGVALGGSKTGDAFEFTDDSFRNRRFELMEKAKSLEAEQKVKTEMKSSEHIEKDGQEDETAI